MRAFDRFFHLEPKYNRSYEIIDIFYDQLVYLSTHVLDASLNKLVSAAVYHLIETKKITIYRVENSNHSKRSFAFKESLINGLESLSKEYDLPVGKLVNIAIYVALDEYSEYLNGVTYWRSE